MINRQPQIRFLGLNDDWEQRKLIEISDIVTGTTPPTKDKDNYGGDRLFVSPADIHGNRYVDETTTTLTEKGYALGRELRGGTTLFVSIGSTIGKLAQIKESATTNQQINAVIPYDEMDDDFVFTMLENEADKIRKLSATQAVPIINKTTFGETKVRFPKKNEQIRIGHYFRDLDNLITLHQRKCDKLINIKKSMLEKMFPQKGEKTPEIRFSGFTDDWEQRKLGDQVYIKSRIGWQALTRDEYLETGDYYLITGTDIDESSHAVDLKRCYYVSKERYEMDDKIQVREGDIIVTKDGTIGKVAMVTELDKPATLNSHLFVLRDLSGNLDNRYLLQMLNSHIFDAFVNSTKTGSTLTGLPQKTFVEFLFPVPSYEEQKLISGFFDNLDNLITLHQRKLEKLIIIKKSMLEKMFV